VTTDSNDSQKLGSLPNAGCGLNAVGAEACAACYFFLLRKRPPVPGEASVGISCKLRFASPDAESVTVAAFWKFNTRTINTLAAGAGFLTTPRSVRDEHGRCRGPEKRLQPSFRRGSLAPESIVRF
jgi:hypothetical protein